MAKLREEEMSEPFAIFKHKMMDSFETDIHLDKDHDASPDCWCKPKKTDDGLFIHERRDN